MGIGEENVNLRNLYGSSPYLPWLRIGLHMSQVRLLKLTRELRLVPVGDESGTEMLEVEKFWGRWCSSSVIGRSILIVNISQIFIIIKSS